MQPLCEDTIFAFTPVPLERVRCNGWSAVLQERFITAQSVMGSVGKAARAVGMAPKSAYRLRERAGAESFARAWDVAIHAGRLRQYDVAMERAINGVTTITVRRGGSVAVQAGPDVELMGAVLRDPPVKARLERVEKACFESVERSQGSRNEGVYGGLS